MEYTERIDDLITELLRTRSRITPSHLPGIPDEEGAAFLARYAEIHGADANVRWDGTRLIRERPRGSVEDRDGLGKSPTESAEPAPTTAQAASHAPAVGGSSEQKHDGEGGRSPVDEILAAPAGRTLLDSRPSGGAVSGWLWLLPLGFALPGGLIAWWLVRDTNRSVARAMLVAGVVLTVLGALSYAAFRGAGQQMTSIIQQGR
jgi:hypothetical protein